MILIDPNRIVKLPVRGSANIITPITWGSPWILLCVRLHFVRTGGTGTDTATFTLSVKDDVYAEANWIGATITARGVSGDISGRIPYDELHSWTFRANERFQMAWTNPDPLEIIWGGEVHIYPYG